MKTTKITMLGTSGAGKTCYMLGMYSFMSAGLHGFTINAKDSDVDIDLNDKWEILIAPPKGETRWPPPTLPQSQEEPVYEYELDFCYGFKPIMSFNWLDYRGRALRDKSTEKDTQKLFEFVKDSDCLFLAVSGEYLTETIVDNGEVNYQVRQQVATELGLKSMNKLIIELQKKINPTNEKPFPVAIVVTKYDLCMERGKDAIVQDVKLLFEPLFQPDCGWLAMICPVSLGKELATNKDSGKIAPINIEKPVTFAIYSDLRAKALEIKNSKYITQQNLEKDKARNFLIRWLFDDDIANNEAMLRDLEGKFQAIQSNLALLAQELQKVPLFLGGKEVTPDVTI